ncbi:DUF736 domain-containing protein [Agrobacterium rhizogenes]|uniref:DUF736 domain-containing protein n=1 Tax=Rhizobium rhizogenes TaxID=359 RepID=UPI001572C453|nr:DUF736 domain-containing protein [Rhizobium rhizogenes]NTF89559.1 DUF736 domain-containing protein [Rhizobium rhizogenes]
MPQIGTFSRDATGFAGCIHTFTLKRDITIVRIEPSDIENAPDYRIHQGEDGPAIGVGWNRTGERAGEYIALLIDDPMLPQPVRATLFRNDDSGASWSLHWSGRHKRSGGG